HHRAGRISGVGPRLPPRRNGLPGSGDADAPWILGRIRDVAARRRFETAAVHDPRRDLVSRSQLRPRRCAAGGTRVRRGAGPGVSTTFELPWIVWGETLRKTDIAIVGAGLSGALGATLLGRAGHAVTLIDPFEACRPDFRCEKLEEAQVETLRRAGVLDEVLP